MSSKEWTIYLEYTIEAAEKIGRYTAGMSFETFISSRMVVDAVIYNLGIVSRVARQIPATIQAAYPDVRWYVMSDLRVADIENYRDVDLEEVWGAVQDGLPSTVRLREIPELERAGESD